jgi:hypothetical protein
MSGVFDSEAERIAFNELVERTQAEEAEHLKGVGITSVDDLNEKYGQLCNLWETGEILGPGDIGLTSDEAREFADKVLIIMNGGPWRANLSPDERALFQKVFSRRPKAKGDA